MCANVWSRHPVNTQYQLHVGSAVCITGNWQASLGAQQDRELLANSCQVLADDIEPNLQPRYSSLSPDQLRKKVHLRSRSSAFSALLRLRSKLFLKTHEYFIVSQFFFNIFLKAAFLNRGYVHIDTPVVTANDCEGAGETFSIAKDPSKEDFFNKKDAFLSVSGQLHLEAMVSGISQVYTLSTGCRADKQQSRNHLTEFRMLEAEIAFLEDLNKLMEIPENFLRYCVFNLLSDPEMMDDFEALGQFSSKEHFSVLESIVNAPPFPRLSYADALELLAVKNQKNRGYLHIDTPVVTANDCEGAGETFSIAEDPSKEDFFNKKDAYLSVSGQLHLEAMVSGISQVYTLSTGCRADKQQSRNHLTEFRMLEAEIAFLEDLNKLMEIPENFLRYCVFNLLSDPEMMDDFEALGQFSSKEHFSVLESIVNAPPFPRLSYADALELLAVKNQKVTGRGLSKLNEAFLVINTNYKADKETVDYYKSPVFVTHFPSEQKPFYMMRSSDGKLTESFDFLCPGVCELAGGSIREPCAE
ncbi:unnamed protein product, partial [Strongylus vulgaris]